MKVILCLFSIISLTACGVTVGTTVTPTGENTVQPALNTVLTSTPIPIVPTATASIIATPTLSIVPTETDLPAPQTAVPTPLMTEMTDITWDKSRETAVVRVIEAAGLAEYGDLINPDPWTLYGDGTILWTEEGEPTPGYTRQVWIGHLDETEIANLLNMINQSGFGSLDNRYESPYPAFDLPADTVAIAFNNQTKVVSVYPAGWEGAPEIFQELRQHLLAIRPEDAALYVP